MKDRYRTLGKLARSMGVNTSDDLREFINLATYLLLLSRSLHLEPLDIIQEGAHCLIEQKKVDRKEKFAEAPEAAQSSSNPGVYLWH